MTYSFSVRVFAVLAIALGAAEGCSSDSAGHSPGLRSDAGALDAERPDTGRHVSPDGGNRSLDAGTLADARETGVVADGSPQYEPIGGSCATDADCPPGLACLGSTAKARDGLGGPAGGLCTKDCSPKGSDPSAFSAAQAVCSAIDPTALCIRVDAATGQSYCFPGCSLGFLLGASKCGGRSDLGCSATTSAGYAFCAPTCAGDASCGGRHCDLASGYCVDQAPTGAPIGTPCGPGSALETSGGQCAGFCLTIQSPSGTPFDVCAGQCVLGELGCGASAGDSGSAPAGSGVCSLSPGFASYFDVGYCAQACSCNDDCLHSGSICQALTLSLGPGQPAGSCVPAFFLGADAGPSAGIPCGDAGAVHTDAGPKDAAAIVDARSGG